MEAAEQATKKFFRVYKTVIQMLTDRGYKVPEIQRAMDFAEFSSKIDKEARSNFRGIYFKTEDESDKIFVFFPDDVKFARDEMEKHISAMKSNGVNSAIFVFKVEPKNIAPADYEAVDKDSGVKVGFHIDFFLEDELVVNITEHDLVPKHLLINDDAKKQLLERYKVRESQLPKILMNDPVARYYGLRRGQVVKIVRDSETAGRYVTYRLVN